MYYYLGDACHNTFVLFDRLDASYVDEEFLRQVHQCLIEEKRDDALVLFDAKTQENTVYARMLVLGLDGAIAEFCGNGARVSAAYLCAHYPHFKRHFLMAQTGTYPLINHGNDMYSVKLARPSFILNKKFIADEAFFNDQSRFSYVEMLEPHLILQEKLSDEELLEIGKKLNQENHLFPKGINVNAWHILDNSRLFVKTYERGVQRLTKSCGTGSMSCAALYQSTGTVSVSTPGGPLEIVLQEDGIELKGAAYFFYKN
jgi:diaminopimelate epimerase